MLISALKQEQTSSLNEALWTEPTHFDFYDVFSHFKVYDLLESTHADIFPCLWYKRTILYP